MELMKSIDRNELKRNIAIILTGEHSVLLSYEDDQKVRDIMELVDSTFNDGFEQGYNDDSKTDDYDDGYEMGKEDGHRTGYDEGRMDGYKIGYKDGRQDGRFEATQ